MPEGPGGCRCSFNSGDEMELPLLADRDYRAVFKASPDAVRVVDSDAVIRDLNPPGSFEVRMEPRRDGGARAWNGCGSRLQPQPGTSRTDCTTRKRLFVRDRGRVDPKLRALRQDGTTVPVGIEWRPGMGESTFPASCTTSFLWILGGIGRPGGSLLRTRRTGRREKRTRAAMADEILNAIRG